MFVSKDENLTKAHVRYLESRLLAEASQVNRFTLEQNQAGGSRLPESDREDMEVFLARIRQLLPVLGSDILAPIAQPAAKAQPGGALFCRIKRAEARGQRTANGFVVFQDSTAVLEQRPSAESYRYVVAERKQLIADSTLIERDGLLGLHEGCGVLQSICGGGRYTRRQRKRAHRVEEWRWQIPKTTRRTVLTAEISVVVDALHIQLKWRCSNGIGTTSEKFGRIRWNVRKRNKRC